MANRSDQTEQIIDQILRGYIECALWLSTDDNNEPLDRNYDEGDLYSEARDKMRSDCAKFYAENEPDCQEWFTRRDPEHTGHDFWLSRNGAGRGFWDRFMVSAGDSEEWEALGNRLQEAARKFGQASLYIGDDGGVYYFAG